MKAAIFNPYLDTLGGGERYTLSFAKVLIANGYDVDLEWKDEKIVKALENRFGLSLDGLNIVQDIKRGDGYDLCFWVSDGSIPALKARKNLLHFQVPFHDVNGNTLINKMKLFRINKIICNSVFTKNVIDKEFGVNSLVVYPPVGTRELKSKRKENIILSVGRFSGLLQSKHQDVLIETFKNLYDSGLKDWKLILAGGSEVGDNKYSEMLTNISEGYPVEIVKSPSFKVLKDLYGRAKIFWSASGFGEDETVNPEKVEHFGITLVEALTCQSVPIVFNAGGHKEIIQNGENGFLWNTEAELNDITERLLKDKSLFRKVLLNTVESSKKYNYEKFESDINKILH